MTLYAWSSFMRNSAFNTVTTNSRGVKSSLTRITLCRRGRSVFSRTLVRGVVAILLIEGAASDHGPAPLCQRGNRQINRSAFKLACPSLPPSRAANQFGWQPAEAVAGKEPMAHAVTEN